jgi:hypothetical protein
MNMNTSIGWFFDKQGNPRTVYAPTDGNGNDVLPDGITHTGQIPANSGIGGKKPTLSMVKKMSARKKAA